MFPERFSDKQLNDIWNECSDSNTHTQICYEDFKSKLGVMLASNSEEETASSRNGNSQRFNIKKLNKVGKIKTKKWDQELLTKIRKNLRSARDDIENIFRDVDQYGQKVISHL